MLFLNGLGSGLSVCVARALGLIFVNAASLIFVWRLEGLVHLTIIIEGSLAA